MKNVRLMSAASAVFALLWSCAPAPADRSVPADKSAEPVLISEASGITLHNGDLCIVDDSVSSAYFRARLPRGAGSLIAVNDLHPEMISLPHGIWVDLEAVECLADGRMIVLSERFRGLVGEDGPIAEYDYPLTEFGRRGLEGLAVRALPDGASRVAVLWEGGYPDPGSLQPQIEQTAGKHALNPVLFVHDIPAGATLDRVRWEGAQNSAVLEVPKPPGEEPSAQRFRAPDLTWYRLPGSEEWGFVVLLSSQNNAGKPDYLHHWLQRFDQTGKPVGDPLDIAGIAPEQVAHANWEGLGWFEEGKSLLMVHEGFRDLPPHAFILELPEDWQYQAR